MITLLLLIPFILTIRSLAHYCADRQMRRREEDKRALLDGLLTFKR